MINIVQPSRRIKQNPKRVGSPRYTIWSLRSSFMERRGREREKGRERKTRAFIGVSARQKTTSILNLKKAGILHEILQQEKSFEIADDKLKESVQVPDTRCSKHRASHSGPILAQRGVIFKSMTSAKEGGDKQLGKVHNLTESLISGTFIVDVLLLTRLADHQYRKTGCL